VKSCTLATAIAYGRTSILTQANELAGGEALRAALTSTVPEIVEAGIAAIRERHPRQQIAESPLERNLRRGLTHAANRWFGLGDDEVEQDLHFDLGRAQARAGRSLEELMGFYRIAGTTMWRAAATLGEQQGAPPEQVYRLAETGYECVDEVSTQAAAGFAAEQSHRSGAAQTRRSEFVRLLLREPQPAREVLSTAAATAGVELAPNLAVFVGAGELYEAFVRCAREQLVGGPREGEFVGLLFDPDGPSQRRRLELAAERAGTPLAIGPAVPLARARDSLARARSLLALMHAGLLAASPLSRAEEHRVELLLSAEPALASEFAQARLAPLLSVGGAKTRANLAATLQEWLRAPGQRKAIAHALGVHPQTVRYRMARLRELFGEQLDDPDGRFELELALRVQRYAELLIP
jgi:PucR C-terminal helix-turn-helix domain